MEHGGPVPRSLLLVRICDRFRCTPLEAAKEIDRNPEAIMALATAYYSDAARMIQRYDSLDAAAQRGIGAPSGRMVDMYREHEAQVASERLEEHRDALAQAGRA